MDCSAMLRQVACFLFLWVVLGPALPAQQDPASNPPQDTSSLPITRTHTETPSLGARSFAHDAFRNPRHKFGFSLGVFEFFDSNVLNTSQVKLDSFGSAIAPSVYANLGNRTSQFHFDYSLNYRLHNDTELSDSADQNASIEYQAKIDRRVLVTVANRISHSSNQAGLFQDPINPTPIVVTPVLATDLFLAGQQTTSDSSSGAVVIELTRVSRVALYGSYNLYRFTHFPLANSSDVQAGFNYAHRLKRWLSFSNGYALYKNQVTPNSQNVLIHRFEVGSLGIDITRSWQFSVGGGLERTTFQGLNQLSETEDATLSWHSQSTIVQFGYHRGIFSVIGLSNVYKSNIFDVRAGRRFNKWINGMVSASYLQAPQVAQTGRLWNYLLHAELDFALRSNVIVSMNTGYSDQRIPFGSDQATKLNRSITYVGVQYLMPTFR